MPTGKDTGDRRAVRSVGVDTRQRQVGNTGVAARPTYAGGLARVSPSQDLVRGLSSVNSALVKFDRIAKDERDARNAQLRSEGELLALSGGELPEDPAEALANSYVTTKSKLTTQESFDRLNHTLMEEVDKNPSLNVDQWIADNFAPHIAPSGDEHIDAGRLAIARVVMPRMEAAAKEKQKKAFKLEFETDQAQELSADYRTLFTGQDTPFDLEAATTLDRSYLNDARMSGSNMDVVNDHRINEIAELALAKRDSKILETFFTQKDPNGGALIDHPTWGPKIRGQMSKVERAIGTETDKVTLQAKLTADKEYKRRIAEETGVPSDAQVIRFQEDFPGLTDGKAVAYRNDSIKREEAAALLGMNSELVRGGLAWRIEDSGDRKAAINNVVTDRLATLPEGASPEDRYGIIFETLGDSGVVHQATSDFFKSGSRAYASNPQLGEEAYAAYEQAFSMNPAQAIAHTDESARNTFDAIRVLKREGKDSKAIASVLNDLTAGMSAAKQELTNRENRDVLNGIAADLDLDGRPGSAFLRREIKERATAIMARSGVSGEVALEEAHNRVLNEVVEIDDGVYTSRQHWPEHYNEAKTWFKRGYLKDALTSAGYPEELVGNPLELDRVQIYPSARTRRDGTYRIVHPDYGVLSEATDMKQVVGQWSLDHPPRGTTAKEQKARMQRALDADQARRRQTARLLTGDADFLGEGSAATSRGVPNTSKPIQREVEDDSTVNEGF